MTRLLLASASPARLLTLRNAGVDPLVMVSNVDEDAAIAEAVERFGQLTPDQIALVLARAKAEDVSARLLADGGDDGDGPEGAGGSAGAQDIEGAAGARAIGDPDGSFELGANGEADIVVGCDSVLEIDGEAFGKPATAGDAIVRWQRMAGSRGVLHTGHWLIDVRPDGEGGTGATLGTTASTEVAFADIDDAEIEAYVATGEPLRVAGAFTVDGLGGPYVEAIDGDYHNVVGLSLPLLRQLLSELQIPWRSLREANAPAPPVD